MVSWIQAPAYTRPACGFREINDAVWSKASKIWRQPLQVGAYTSLPERCSRSHASNALIGSNRQVPNAGALDSQRFIASGLCRGQGQKAGRVLAQWDEKKTQGKKRSIAQSLRELLVRTWQEQGGNEAATRPLVLQSSACQQLSPHTALLGTYIGRRRCNSLRLSALNRKLTASTQASTPDRLSYARLTYTPLLIVQIHSFSQPLRILYYHHFCSELYQQFCR